MKKWVLPDRLKPYLPVLRLDLKHVEEARNCDGVNCNIEVNAPRALVCLSINVSVDVLVTLYKAGLLKAVRS